MLPGQYGQEPATPPEQLGLGKHLGGSTSGLMKHRKRMFYVSQSNLKESSELPTHKGLPSASYFAKHRASLFYLIDINLAIFSYDHPFNSFFISANIFEMEHLLTPWEMSHHHLSSFLLVQLLYGTVSSVSMQGSIAHVTRQLSFACLDTFGHSFTNSVCKPLYCITVLPVPCMSILPLPT